MKIARAALLTPADFGKGWTPTPVSTRAQSLGCAKFVPDVNGAVETGVASRTFRGAATQGVGQAAWRYATTEQARFVWARTVGKGLLRCLVDLGRHAGGLAVTRIVSGELQLPALGERSAGYRVIVTAKVKGKTVRLYFDELLVGSGRSLTQLTFGSSSPIPSAVELTLVRAAAKRLGTSGAA